MLFGLPTCIDHALVGEVWVQTSKGTGTSVPKERLGLPSSQDRYDVIWLQWVLLHLTDHDLVALSRRNQNRPRWGARRVGFGRFVSVHGHPCCRVGYPSTGRCIGRIGK